MEEIEVLRCSSVKIWQLGE